MFSSVCHKRESPALFMTVTDEGDCLGKKANLTMIYKKNPKPLFVIRISCKNNAMFFLNLIHILLCKEFYIKGLDINVGHNAMLKIV